jgi:hypothetical protein
MNLTNLTAKLKRAGTVARTTVDRERMAVRAEVHGPGESRYHEVEYTAAMPSDLTIVKAFAIEVVLIGLVELPEKELREHGWWEWVQQNKEWVLALW